MKRLALAISFVCVATTAWAAKDRPQPVSPGNARTLAEVRAVCPTFSWDAVAQAIAHELVVYSVDAEGQAGTDPRLRVTLTGSVGSWTPSVEQCLERGQQYAWAVRAQHKKGWSDWSEARIFTVSARGTSDLEEAFARVLDRYIAEGRLTAADLEVLQSALTGGAEAEAAHAEAEPRSEREASTDSPAPAAVQPTQLSVDGGVVAASFTGDGSGLTSIGSSSIADGSVSSTDIANGTITYSDTNVNSVQRRVTGTCGSSYSVESIANDGTVNCEYDDFNSISIEGFHYAENFNGGSTYAYAYISDGADVCFLSRAGFRDIDSDTEDDWCLIEKYGTYWRLIAHSEGDSDARCGMLCLNLVNSRVD